LVPISPRFFATVGVYLAQERPADALTERLFVVLKGCLGGVSRCPPPG
jgi:integrase/recombinase XerD